MNNLIRQFAKESHLDVYGLGKDHVKWESCLEKFAELIVKECADVAGKDVRYFVLQHFGVE